jgi:hypothetical protein
VTAALHLLRVSHGLSSERRAQGQLTPVYQQRREALKNIPKFWPVALLKHSMFALQAQHDADRVALSYLEDVWVVRDSREPKVFTLEFVRSICYRCICSNADFGIASISKRILTLVTRC